MRAKLFVVIVVFAASMVSCGGGSGDTGTGGNNSGGADFATITVDASAPYTYTEAPSASYPFYDPYIMSIVSGTSTGLYAYTNGAPRMQISFAGATAGTYTISNGGNAVYYMPDGGDIYSCSPAFSGSSGTITITEFGPASGGHITGSYDVIAKYGTYNASSAHLTASFSVTRN